MAFPHELSRPRQGPEGKFGGGGTDTDETRVPGGMLVLTLDDVLARVPTRALKPGLHDPSRRLHFAMEELLEGISRGRATIMLSKLAERYPETFEAPPEGTEDSPIYLPLQKLIQQIGRAARTPPEKPAAPSVEPAPMAQAPEPAPPAKPARTDADPVVEAPVTRLLRRLKVMQEPVESAPPKAAPAASASSVPSVASPESTGRAEPQEGERERASGRAGVPPASEGVFARAVAATPEPVTTETAHAVAAAVETPVPPTPPEVEEKKPEEPKPAPEKLEPPNGDVPKPEEKLAAPLTPPPLPVAPPPAAKVPVLEPPAPVVAPAPEVPHSPVLENPPANLETNVRIPGRPTVRPPSLQGPAGLVGPENAPPPAPAMPGFVFAPRPSNPLSDFSNPVYPPEADLPEVHIPPLFPVHPGPLEEEEPAAVDPPVATPDEPPRVAERASAEVPPPPEPAKETALEREPEAKTPEPREAAAVSDEPASSEATEPPNAAADDDDDAKERRILHPTRGENAARAGDLLGTHFSLARIDQEPLQAIFMTEEFLDLARVSQLSCGFPGITGCMIVAGDALAQGGERPAGLDAQALCKLTRQLSAVAAAFPEELPAVQTYTLHVGNRALSIFARPNVSLCLVHSHRGFLPGVRERLAAVADTLSRGLSGEAEEG
jgi:hypothetical protein